MGGYDGSRSEQSEQGVRKGREENARGCHTTSHRVRRK